MVIVVVFTAAAAVAAAAVAAGGGRGRQRSGHSSSLLQKCFQGPLISVLKSGLEFAVRAVHNLDQICLAGGQLATPTFRLQHLAICLSTKALSLELASARTCELAVHKCICKSGLSWGVKLALFG